MLRGIVTMILVVCATFAQSDTARVVQYCHDNFPGYRLHYVREGDVVMRDDTLCVEYVISHSLGDDGGMTTNGSYIGYNARVPKGKRVVSYVIWNYDDIVAVYDNGKMR